LKVLTRCGSSPCVCQMRRTLASLMPTSRAMVRVDQWVALAGVVCVVLDDCTDYRCLNRRRASGPGCILEQSFHAPQEKPPSPQRRHPRADPELLADLLVLIAFCSQQYDLAAHRYPHRHHPFGGIADPHNSSDIIQHGYMVAGPRGWLNLARPTDIH